MLLYATTLGLLWLCILPQNDFATASPLIQSGLVSDPSQNASATLDASFLFKRVNLKAPSTDELVAMIDHNPDYQRGARPSVFWTGLYLPNTPGRPYFETRNWGVQKFGARANFALYTDFYIFSEYQTLMSWEKRRTTAEKDLFIRHESKAFARRSAGTVYVVMLDGSEPGDGSVWKTWEAPTLTRRPEWVDQIIRVGFPSKQETTIWRTGDTPLYDPAPPGK